MNDRFGRLKLPLLVLLLLLTCSACGNAEADQGSTPALDAIQVQLFEQAVEGQSKVHAYKATLTDANGSNVSVDAVKLSLSMTMRDGMKHKTSGQMKREEDGSYQINLKWEMEGTWLPVMELKQDRNRRTVAANQIHSSSSS